jgi:putative AdoMet-dependent methyltransferase
MEVMMKPWIIDESRHCGVDYADGYQADRYDENHGRFRNYREEFDNLLRFAGIANTETMTMLDLGCGTGATAVPAAGVFKTVYAVDVSAAMLDRTRRKLAGNPADVRFVQAGFLSYEHLEDPVDLAVTRSALHHLPDFWKQVALSRIHRMTAPDGLLFIQDVVFRFEPEETESKVDAWISDMERMAGTQFRPEIESHVRDEHSTFHWIMTGMIERAGFQILKCEFKEGFITEYLCRRR